MGQVVALVALTLASGAGGCARAGFGGPVGATAGDRVALARDGGTAAGDRHVPASDRRIAEGPSVSCTTKYGKISGFELCNEAPSSCAFAFKVTAFSSCTGFCAANGGTCLQANAVTTAPYCKSIGASTSCSEGRTEAVCTCTR